MLNKKEITSILVMSLILGFILSMVETTQIFLIASLTILVILLINTIAKKMASYELDSQIQVKIWEFQRWWYGPGTHFKKPVTMGAFFPILLKVLTAGAVNWLACLTYEVKPKVYRAAKRYGTMSFSEMTEYHIGLIAVWGILANLAFAVLGYMAGFETFAKLSIFYAAYNLVPYSELDGNKIFFGSIIWWVFLAAITFVGLGYVWFIV